ncbi:MAG: ABC transporter ATP-binding protein [Actinomycetia bacterium]|nr:ABC transporter ATP-binding protein [Actinomycetes bacterium]
MSADDILTVSGVRHAFGGLVAVDDCSFAVRRGALAALIGPNGAGKSTMVNVIAGALPLQAGRIVFDGRDISGMTSHDIARAGLIRTFQISRELGRMTVLENLMMAAHNPVGETLTGALFRRRQWLAYEQKLLAKALDLLKTFNLLHLRDEYAQNLSGGQKRLLELARAVMAEPKLLLLDEPMAGINPALVDELGEHIRALRDQGITFLMVEHNLGLVERLCDQVIVMAEGRTLASGTMGELRANRAVVDAYLGGAVREHTGS